MLLNFPGYVPAENPDDGVFRGADPAAVAEHSAVVVADGADLRGGAGAAGAGRGAQERPPRAEPDAGPGGGHLRLLLLGLRRHLLREDPQGLGHLRLDAQRPALLLLRPLRTHHLLRLGRTRHQPARIFLRIRLLYLVRINFLPFTQVQPV